MAYQYYDEKTAVCLARDVYRRDDRPPLPDGWSIYWDCPEEYQKDGYFGSAYRCELIDTYGNRFIEIVIAHRGTDNFDGIVEDAEMKLFDTIPQQFYDGAIPFIQFIFGKLDQDYPWSNNGPLFHGDQLCIGFTGHSLGATLSELSVIRYVNYFNVDNDGNPCRNTTYPRTYVFDSPGSKNLVIQQLERKEITEKDVQDGGDNIDVYNSDIDAINTCMQTSSTSSTVNKFIDAAVGNKYSSLTNGSKLPYAPDPLYYFSDYSVNDQHPITYIYDWVRGRDSSIYVFSVNIWPVGFNMGYRAYRSYYADFCSGFENHNKYWDQYTSVYWDQNPNIHDEYDDRLFAFQDYYFKNVCYYFDGYAIQKELNYKFSPADMQKIARFLSVDDKLMISRAVANSDKDKDKARSCCGFGFFQVVEAQKMATTAAQSVGKVVTETGEELSRIMPASSNEHQKQSFLFFKNAVRFIGVDDGIFENTRKSTLKPKIG